jgi:2-amino-4-hydroxy-6-hydroxymethyldihydropteridine diphosphokinase
VRRDREVLLSLGSNVEPARWVPRALALLEARFDVRAVSPRYSAEAVGDASHPPFVNLSVRLRTDLPPRALRAACRHVEERCGRRRCEDRFAPRTLDVDVVLQPGQPPAEELRREAYVLVPSADAWPDARPEGWARTLVEEVAARFPDWARAHPERGPEARERAERERAGR